MRDITESFIQQQCYMWLNNSYGMLKHEPNRWLFFSVPNEVAMAIRSVLIDLGVRESTVNKAISIILSKINKTGFLPGVSDCMIAAPNGLTLYIEFKTPTGKQSPDQIEFQRRVTDLGHHYYLCRSLAQFQEIIKSHE